MVESVSGRDRLKKMCAAGRLRPKNLKDHAPPQAAVALRRWQKPRRSMHREAIQKGAERRVAELRLSKQNRYPMCTTCLCGPQKPPKKHPVLEVLEYMVLDYLLLIEP